jgi:hypothetical protein
MAIRYVSPDEDSDRWTGFPFRDGDIVMSTRSLAGLVDAARFEWMKSIAEDAVPDPSGVLKDNSMFFRRGASGAGRGLHRS